MPAAGGLGPPGCRPPGSASRADNRHDRCVTDDGYLLDNAQAEAGARFGALAELFDPWTHRHLLATGLRAGWHCWEVGAGSPGVPAWLAKRVGPGGRVVATDIDTSWLTTTGRYEVLRHDVAADEPPGTFDLVHARLLLTHVPQRDAALAALIHAVRPGGWLVIEDADPRCNRCSARTNTGRPRYSAIDCAARSGRCWPIAALISSSGGRSRGGYAPRD